MAGRTRSIRVGTAVVCLSLHHPLDAAEQVAVADALAGGRTAFGFGSGSTPEEANLFGADLTDDATRQARFAEALQVIRAAWSGDWSGISPRYFSVPPHRSLPSPPADLPDRCWVAVNSEGSARIAGRLRFHMLFSHLRTPEQYRRFSAAYREEGGPGLIAANRPVFVGPDDRTAFAIAEPALRTIWRRFRDERKIPADTPEPDDPSGLCAHPINFLVGGPETVARKLLDLHAESPFDVANVEVRWAGLSHEQVLDSLRRLMEDVAPRLE
jgi:alkanesulfonate monooxygenase SsuD/methylene tetrahydromethanopterin reductase-like flavin-dependent oxidoreductase (luciferase family)